MKTRHGKRLTLHRDTLRQLEADALRRAEGAQEKGILAQAQKKGGGTSTLECTQ